MARYAIPLLVFTLALVSLSVTEGCRSCSTKRAFARISCRHTRYQKECVQTLITHLNSTNYSQQNLAQIFLEVSLQRARLARAYVAKWSYRLKQTSPQTYQSARDCIDQIGESMARISQSIQELQHVRKQATGDEFLWHCSNMETWTSTALTYQTTCLDALPGSARGRNFEDKIKMRVDNAARLTSNALAMVNQFVTRQRVVRGATRP